LGVGAYVPRAAIVAEEQNCPPYVPRFPRLTEEHNRGT
jgi:hypothetical protein